MRGGAAGLVLLALSGAAAAQSGGAALFETCRACHALEREAPEGAGPNLAGLLGRKVAGDPAFDYSPALKAAGAAGLTWDAERLARFLADPEAMFPGLWMGGRGLGDAQERRALVEWIARNGGGA